MSVALNVRYGARDQARPAELLERLRIGHLADVARRDLRRRASARRAGPGARAGPRRPPPRRAALRPRRACAGHRARRASGASRRAAVAHHPRHAHDFEDAAALADVVGVIVDSRLRQVGAPADLVAAPTDPFVASFTGATLLHGVAARGSNGLTEVALDTGGSVWSTDDGSGRVAVALHPWDVSIAHPERRLGAQPRARAGGVGRAARQPGACPSRASRGKKSLRRRPIGSRSAREIVVATFQATATRLLSLASREGRSSSSPPTRTGRQSPRRRRRGRADWARARARPAHTGRVRGGARASDAMRSAASPARTAPLR